MALNAYLKLKGQKQGEIKGSVIRKGREDEILVIAVSHEIVSPRDAASGLPTGKRMHKPFVITKEIDKSSPLLMNALCTNENLTSFVLSFSQPSTKGGKIGSTEEDYYEVELTNATVSSIITKMDNNVHPDTKNYAPYEEISFTYQKIAWTIKDGNVTAQDDWEVKK